MRIPDGSVGRLELGIGQLLLYDRRTHTLRMSEPDARVGGLGRLVVPSHSPRPGSLSAPLKLFLAFTRGCNLECPMCFARGREYAQPEISRAALERVIAEAADMGVFEIRLTGGEPTVHPWFFDLVRQMDAAGMNVSMNSHGAYGDRLLERIIDSPIDDIRISIDGTEDAHDSLRGRGTFRRAVHAVRTLKAAGKRVRINTMVFTGNRHAIDDIIRVADELTVGIRFCPMRAIGRAADPAYASENVISRDEWHSIEHGLAERGLLRRGVACFSVEDTEDFSLCAGPDAGLEESQCGPWLTQMGIDPEGEAYAGGRIDDIPKSLAIGSILDTPLATLWQSALSDVTERILPSFPTCAACALPQLWGTWTDQLSGLANNSRHLY